jgi:hypothetical protein
VRDSDWETGEQWPVIFTEVRDELIPNPPEWSSEWLDLSPAAGRFVIHIDMSGPWATRKEAALAVVDFLLGFQAFRIPLDLDWTLVELPAATYRRGEILVQDLPNDDGWASPVEWLSTVRNISYSSDDDADLMLRMCDSAFRSGDGRTYGAFPAVIYHRLSALEFGFAPDDVRRLLGRRDLRPETPFHRARSEEAFHNAYKGIEAVLGGQPPKAVERLRARLTTLGIDPDLRVRLPDGRDDGVAQRTARLRRIRDQRSAHGGRSGSARRQLAYHDVIEAQWVVAALIKAAIEAVDSPSQSGA